jgi:hypothetical protein
MSNCNCFNCREREQKRQAYSPAPPNGGYKEKPMATKTTVKNGTLPKGKRFKDFRPGDWLMSAATGALGLKTDDETIFWMNSGQPRSNTGPIEENQGYVVPAEVNIEVRQ